MSTSVGLDQLDYVFEAPQPTVHQISRLCSIRQYVIPGTVFHTRDRKSNKNTIHRPIGIVREH